jgi:hypothetical protein
MFRKSKKDEAVQDAGEEKQADAVKEKKKNARAADKKKKKDALNKAADRLIVDIALQQPGANASKTFLSLNADLDKLDAEAAKHRLARRGVRGRLREMKVDLSSLDRVRKLKNMEPEDVIAKKATEALYEQQLGLNLSDDQKHLLGKLNEKQEADRQALIKASGGNTGKEVGSAVDEEALPAKNEALAHSASEGSPSNIH